MYQQGRVGCDILVCGLYCRLSAFTWLTKNQDWMNVFP